MNRVGAGQPEGPRPDSPHPLLPEAVRLRWEKWMIGEGEPREPTCIWQQLVQMAHLRDVHERTLAIAAGNAEMPASAFFAYLGHMYFRTQSLAVRRQLDRDRRSISLIRLLDALVAAIPAGHVACGIWALDRYTVLSGNDVASDRDALLANRDLAVVSDFVNKRVAHTDRAERPDLSNVTLGQVHRAIEVLTSTYQRYETLLSGRHTPWFTPTIQHDWEAVFRIKWMTDGDPG